MPDFNALVAACLLTAVPGASIAQRGGAADAPANKALIADARPRGAEQANVWIPLDVITLGTEAERRRAMLARIRTEVEKRHSTIDLAGLDQVLATMNAIPRERFVDKPHRKAAYVPASLDIGFGQTISDAYIVAIMTVAAKLTPDANVLDIGTGSGYQAALLSRLARTVTSVEIVPQLTRQARTRLQRLGYGNVAVRQGDGFEGWVPSAPFDVIVVAAGTKTVPKALVDQLKVGGRLIIPVGPTALEEELLVLTKLPDALDECSLGPATFVPMTGRVRALDPAKAAAPRSNVRLCFGAAVT
ncbi:protein-L-isoaspartate(D-aspartate) O-methyltransferase [Sphingomonas sp. CARO-RG-8B-R24-01]|uniref:protein-L-isoaspartate(D-aspartate) O-methyltransferase n=1 Tax=Sphingomonas sp. CARO-RG-8B-R24-01 TaxID=2914831 RepID=UPI001F585CE1|nr:protein-L-isoaspartate(D-aspartate) O-methyltransferase [Sphingomonas sp. CARO-RG-8B-R24-01]